MSQSRTFKAWRILGIILLAAAILALAINGRQWWPQLEQLVSNSGPTGFLLFMLVFIVLTIFCFPVSVLGFTAGALYGPWFGLLLLYPSGILSGTIIFFLGRGLLREFVQRWTQKNPKLQAIENMASDHAVKLNILTRLSPFNFGLASYALAVGKSSLSAYIRGILVILPSMTAQVWIGALAGKAGKEGGNGIVSHRMELIFLALGIMFFFVLTWQVGKMIRQAILSGEKE